MNISNARQFRYRTAFAMLMFTLSVSVHADDPYSAQPGSLDLHFGEWGLGLATSAEAGAGYATAIGNDSQSRIVVGGDTCIGEYCGPVLMRFDANGRLDTSGNWGEDGAIFLSTGEALQDYTQLAITPADNDGWWITWQDFARKTLHLLRIDADGGFVPGFGPGNVSESANLTANAGLHKVSHAGEEKLITVTAEAVSPPLVHVTQRYADGRIDDTFGNGGRAAFLAGAEDYVLTSKVLPDGRIAVMTIDWGWSTTRVFVLEADGSGLSQDFGNSGVVDLGELLPLDEVSAEYLESPGMAISPSGALLIGVSVCCDQDGQYRAGIVAVDENGALDTTYGGGDGYVLNAVADSYIMSSAFGIDSTSGRAALEVWFSNDLSDSMLYFTADGEIDNRYGNGTGIVRDLRWPDANGMSRWLGQLVFDADGGLLLANDRFFPSSNILSLEGFGTARFLAPGETRTYDVEPDPVSDFTWPSAPLNTALGLMLSSFGTRDVAIEVVSESNGKIGLPGDSEADYSFLSRKVTLPVGVVAKMFHKTASTPGTYSETLFSAGSAEFTLGSVTGVDDQADLLFFDPLENVPVDTFVFSGPDVISDIDVALDISVENGCYFLFDDFDELPDDFEDWPEFLLPENCISEPGTVEDGQIVFLAHISASETATVTTTTFHYGDNTALFISTTTTDSVLPDNEPDAFDIPVVTGAEIDTDIVIGPIAMSGFDTSFSVGDTLNDDTARFEVSTNGESWTGEIEIAPGNPLWIRMRSSPLAETSLTGEMFITLPGNTKTFTITTRAAADPIDDPVDDPNPDVDEPADSSGGGAAGLAFLLTLPFFLRRSRKRRVAVKH